MTKDSVVHVTCNTIMFPRTYLFFFFFFCFFFFFFGGGGGAEILREINSQDHQTSMARISASICSIWSWSSRSFEGIGKQYSIAIVYGINNTSSKIIKIQNNEFSDRPHKSAFCSRTLHMTNDAAESNL